MTDRRVARGRWLLSSSPPLPVPPRVCGSKKRCVSRGPEKICVQRRNTSLAGGILAAEVGAAQVAANAVVPGQSGAGHGEAAERRRKDEEDRRRVWKHCGWALQQVAGPEVSVRGPRRLVPQVNQGGQEATQVSCAQDGRRATFSPPVCRPSSAPTASRIP